MFAVGRGKEARRRLHDPIVPEPQTQSQGQGRQARGHTPAPNSYIFGPLDLELFVMKTFVA